ncbi:MAG TPA: hypothetical protein VFE77_03795 [Rhodanobacter sp.]|nr:hypothetical protein [Rhodanobacter sp.]
MNTIGQCGTAIRQPEARLSKLRQRKPGMMQTSLAERIQQPLDETA